MIVRNNLSKQQGLWLIMAALLVIVGASTVTGQEMGYTPIFEPGDCLTSMSARYITECGDLIVPEDRSQPDGATVRLPVIVYRSLSDDPEPDPLIYLTGGGGVNQMSHPDDYPEIREAVLESRDFIFYNQRGADFTEPSLECGFTEFLWERAKLDISQDERDAMWVQFWLDCQEDLIARGINVQHYSSAVNAADANDLRVALGYERANFYGASYGTRIGLDLIRDYPDGVRSLIIESVLPPQVSYHSDYASNALRSFDLLFAACAADATCNRHFPDLETMFYQVVDELNASPIRFRTDKGPIYADGHAFMEAIYVHVFVTQAIPYAPIAIYEASRGNYGPVEGIITGGLNNEFINLAVWWSIACQEEVPFDSVDRARELAADLPPQISATYTESFASTVFELCESWQVFPDDPIANEPVVSDVPTLILTGEYDPITPPHWGALASETLSDSFFYEFPGLSHQTMRANDCAREIGLQFLNDPRSEPDSTCMASLSGPKWYTP